MAEIGLLAHFLLDGQQAGEVDCDYLDIHTPSRGFVGESCPNQYPDVESDGEYATKNSERIPTSYSEQKFGPGIVILTFSEKITDFLTWLPDCEPLGRKGVCVRARVCVCVCVFAAILVHASL